MKDEEMKTMAKRTAKEVFEDLKQTPAIVVPFAVAGVMALTWWGIVLIIAGMVGITAYLEYQEMKESQLEAVAPEEETPLEPQQPVSTDADSEKKDH